MSPTYWTSSQIITAARANDWEIIKAQPPISAWDIPAWGARKGRFKVMVRERRDGGLIGVWITYPKSDGANCDYLGPLHRGKLAEVLEFLRDPTSRGRRG
jgi:hypothetical protein